MIFSRPPRLPSTRLRPRPIRIAGTGRHLPRLCLEDNALDRKLGLANGTLERLSGVKRRFFSDDENAAQMGARAARAALDSAGLELKDIDLLLCVSGTIDQIIPCNAALIMQELDQGDLGIPCFDINSTCLGFIVGLDTISFALAGGRYRHVLVVASELPSRGLNPDELEAYSLFGDAAAATVISAADTSDGSCILGARHETYPSGAAHCNIYGGGGRLPAYHFNHEPKNRYLFHMDGRKIFKQASQLMPAFFQRLMDDCGVSLADIDLVIPHQASESAVELLRRKLEIPPERLVYTLPQYGNNIAASIPLALNIAIEEGRLRRGHKVLLLGTSAGFSMGGMVIQY